jgi:hypothetical protein
MEKSKLAAAGCMLALSLDGGFVSAAKVREIRDIVTVMMSKIADAIQTFFDISKRSKQQTAKR